jgi:hypothetical protein
VGVFAQSIGVVEALAIDATLVVMQRDILSDAGRARELFVADGTDIYYSDNNWNLIA